MRSGDFGDALGSGYELLLIVQVFAYFVEVSVNCLW